MAAASAGRRPQLLWIGLLALLPPGTHQGKNERRILENVMKNYNTLERPVANESLPITVKFGLTLQQILDVDEKNQILTSNNWLNLEWMDYNLQWDPEDHGGVHDLHIHPKYLWKPDVLMYNSADEKFDGTYPTNVVVDHNGSCLFVPPGIFKSTCKIDITWFPFDEQRCDMKFGSWTYDGWQLDLVLKEKEGDTSTFISNGEWDLLGLPGKRNVKVYDCCPTPYVDITFTIKIRRRTLYYFSTLIIPCVLISSMALLGFTLPPDSGEKLTLGTYFNCIMFMVASSVVLTVVVLNYHHRTADTHRMPQWISTLFLNWLPWFLRMSRPGRKITRKTIMMNNKMKELELKERSSKSLLANVLDMDDDFRGLAPTGGYGGLEYTPSSGCAGTHRELQALLRELRFITARIRKDDEIREIISDWKFAAMVVDRFCLIVFTLFTVVATIAILLTAPHILVA
ncbi:neuronal acetylcholine receptor subunit alpha-7-like isoform X8 [Pollicipes pollicipes]|uniref:neuronal acetylcholine receptor subunit alpha-7-like isoform X8 n=1 Tax=Pollicipes pollicipes TaxID=41117 RepID=UPI0018854CB7|nr:neuronal acetylcholine receptor subunit alpha-7-like isoform X8 [Pollicipes pollicipes]